MWFGAPHLHGRTEGPDRVARIRGVAVILAAAGLVLVTIGPFAARLGALRALRATGPSWSFPSRVYSDGVPLEVGRTLPEPYLVAELAARGYRLAPAAARPGTYARVAGGFEIVVRGLLDEHDPLGGGGPERVRIVLQDGRVAAVRREGGVPGALPPDLAHPPRLEPVLVSLLLDEHRVLRTWVSLERVPGPVRDAVIASEDRRYFGHVGVDPIGAARALFADLRHHGIRQGGSTITQQLARGLFLGHRRTLTRKLAEIPLALGLETLLTKRQILEMYLNSVYWGQARGFAVGGVAEAARWYFDAPIESLGVLEGATLAAMIPAPNLIQPFTDPERVRERRNAVLQDLVATGHLDGAQSERLQALPLDVRQGKPPIERFPSYSGYVRDALADVLPHHAAVHEGLSIFTTMDLAWQSAAEAEVSAGLAALDGGGRRTLQGAFVALEPGTCAVRAMVGGRNPAAFTFNRAYQARRQTGSAIKPIVYAAAFSQPSGLTPATTVADTPRTFGSGRWAWRPHNFDGEYHPEVTLAKALEKSLNLATANVVDRIGPDEVARAAAAFGLGRLKPVMSIGLGSNEVSLLALTSAFAVFVDRGIVRSPSPVRIVTTHDGRAVLGPPQDADDAVPQAIASLMTGLLQNVVRYGVAYPLRAQYGFDRPVAGKTGTTDDFKDAWFIGFTPDLVAGTWVGYDRPASIGRQAAHTALPLWARVAGRLLDGFPKTPFPSDAELDWVEIDPWSGCLADSTGGPRELTPFLPGTAPLAPCGLEAQHEPIEDLDAEFGRDTLTESSEDTTSSPPDTSDDEVE